MLKKTSTIIALAIATILTAYILALTLSNQVFAQSASNSSHPAIENEIKYAKDRLAPKKMTIGAMKAGSSEVMYEQWSTVTEQYCSSLGGCSSNK